MSTELLVILTLVEIVALVAVLALYLIVLTRRLHAVASILGQVSGGVTAVQGDVALVGAGASILNRKLETISNALPPIAEKAEALAAQRG